MSLGLIRTRKEEDLKNPNDAGGLQSPPAAAPGSIDVGTITLKSCCVSGIGPAHVCRALGAGDTQALA